jgi:acyl-CoA thioester hydrolase
MTVKLNQREDFDHFETVQTRWKDMDALRHINHAAYLSFMETARLNYCQQFGFSLDRWEAEENFILASMKVDYIRQTHHPAILEIGLGINRVGNKSFDIITAVFVKEQEAPVVQAVFTLAAYSYRENRSIPVPEAIRKACLKFD